MQRFEGIYSYDSPDNIQKAVVTITNKRIEIHLKDAHGNPRVVYWYWYNVVKGNGAEWHHTGLPTQTLRGMGYEFTGIMEKQLSKKRRSPVVPFFLGLGALLIVLLLAVYFWLIPFLAGRTANALPVEYEIKMGESAYNAMAGDFKVNDSLSVLVNKFFAALHIPTRYPVKITVVEQEQINAFAVPGGRIVVFTGLLKQMQRPEELAALLAHEFSHVELRHTTRSLLQTLGTYMMVSLVFGDLSGITAIVVENANTLKHLEYSRSLEKEADLNGLALLEARHINGEGYIWLFRTLEKDAGAAASEWLSSHPDLGNRARYVQEKIEHSSPAAIPADMQAIWQKIKGKE